MEVYYDKNSNRLVYAGEDATPEFWDEHWSVGNIKESIESGRDDKLILGTLQRYIPDKKGRILEGGCGRGQVVYCMQTHGYECIGVDVAAGTINKVKEAVPELDVKVADVRRLPFPDAYLRGYWSLGVIEHFRDGYGDVLKEMRRVLAEGGYLFLTFPYMSPLRKLKARLGFYRAMSEVSVEKGERFYQFVMDAKSVVQDFTGFKLVESRRLDGVKGFKDEVSLARSLLQRLYDYRGNNPFIGGLRGGVDKLLATFSAHMLFLVFKKVT